MSELTELIEELLVAYEAKEIQLNAWEAEFLDDIKDSTQLSVKQKQKLMEIAEKL